jgi:hypothetical protein
MPIVSARRTIVAWLLLGILVAAPGVQAQKNDSRLTGTIVDKASRAPLARAEIIFVGDSRSVLSDSVGRYLFDSLPSGVVRFVVRAAGYPVTPLTVALMSSESMAHVIELDSSSAGSSSAQRLPRVSIDASRPVSRRLVDFERRRVNGLGQYITRAQIDSAGFNNLQDAMRNLRGVHVDCAANDCHIRMARAPMQCTPDYVVDERVDNFFGPLVPIRDIEALEVYTGASDVAGEFAGRNAGCGVIVIWTKSGPSRRKP